MHQELSRRTLLKGGGAAIAGLSALRVAGPAHAFPGQAGEQVIPWLDPPPPNPVPGAVGKLLDWEALSSWLTPADNFFTINHYGFPTVDMVAWRLAVSGLVARPQSLSLTDLKARSRHEVTFTLECSGNHGFPWFIGGIGNARWGGTPLAPLLERAGVLEQGTEVVFWGADQGPVAIRDNGGVLRPGHTGQVQPDADGNLDLKITEHFARSMSLEEALAPENLLCYEMNGAPLPSEHGFPLRLIAPGWYGVANVKWLTRIEVMDQRYTGRFMARDYVSIREQARDGQTVWTFNNVKHDRLKSAPAKVTRRRGRYAIMGAAWGAPIAEVEVQIDDGPWRTAILDDQRSWKAGRRDRSGLAWRFWTFDWGKPDAGEHSIRSRAFDVDGNIQPPPDDPFLAAKVTYWENNGQIARRVAIPS
ncbi:MAG TPA: molybdopterin-dependent oxidoreductase [Solirubrobacteraceae bacterium]|nr:molybdopterin-dependent oxidoreductase [Solirubrobacteraceae bacterium]